MHSYTVGVRAVILSPTRELAIQTHKVRLVTPPRNLHVKNLAHIPLHVLTCPFSCSYLSYLLRKFCVELSHFVTPKLQFCCLVGGDAMEDQFDMLAQNPDCLVATPGRLQHILAESQV